jgi:glutaconate CoA-transferase subunit B
MQCTQDELLISALTRTLAGAGTVAVGSVSPLPAAAALLAQALDPARTRALIFLNSVNDPFPEAGSEIYDRIGQGRIDAFFLSGGQIDGQANLNNVGVGEYPDLPVRFPGSYGMPFIYLMVPRVILFREEHTPRALVRKVDFVSAAGVTPPEVFRRGGPTDLVTSIAAFTFDRQAGRFWLASVHPGHTVDEVVRATGFEFDRAADVPETPAPSAEWLKLLHGPVRDQVAETYPTFAATRLGNR